MPTKKSKSQPKAKSKPARDEEDEAPKKKKKKKGVFQLDFSDTSGGYAQIEEGRYHVTIESIEESVSKASNKPVLDIRFTITKGKYKGETIFNRLSLQPQALFNMKNLLKACGYEAEGAVEVDSDELVGESLIVRVEEQEYNGKARMQVTAYNPADEDDEDEEEDDDDSGEKESEEDDEDDTDDDDDDEEDDEDE